jgi:hypothetical protein
MMETTLMIDTIGFFACQCRNQGCFEELNGTVEDLSWVHRAGIGFNHLLPWRKCLAVLILGE